MTLADLGRRLARVDDARTRWKLVWEFLEEYRWEADDVQPSLLQDEPPATGDERWDALLAALAERLARRDVVADVFVVGGAAMALAYDAARVTRESMRCSSPTESSWKRP